MTVEERIVPVRASRIQYLHARHARAVDVEIRFSPGPEDRHPGAARLDVKFKH
jgi:hypothetical protein